MKYIPKDQLAAAKDADPVPRFRAHLIDAGVCTDDELTGIEEDALDSGRSGPETVMAADPPLVDELERDVYATPIAYPV